MNEHRLTQDVNREDAERRVVSEVVCLLIIKSSTVLVKAAETATATDCSINSTAIHGRNLIGATILSP